MKLFNGKVYNLIRTVIFVGLAAFVITALYLLDLSEIERLRYFIGALMIFYGAEEIIYTAFNRKNHISVKSLYWDIVEIILGLVMILFVGKGEADVIYAVVCVSWATWSILRETRELVEITLEFKEKATGILNISESLTVIALSVTMIIEPTKHHAYIHLWLLVAELLTTALFPVLDNACKPLMERIASRRKPVNECGQGEKALNEADAEKALNEAALSEDLNDSNNENENREVNGGKD